MEDLLLLFVAGHAFRLASRWPEKWGCLATARNVASVVGYSPSGFLAVACRPDNRAPSARRYPVLAAHANTKVDLQVSSAWQETLRPLTQTHVSRFYLKRIDDSRTSDSRGRSVGRSVEHAANDCRREKIWQDRLIGEAPPMGVSGAFLDPPYTTYSPQFRAGSVEIAKSKRSRWFNHRFAENFARSKFNYSILGASANTKELRRCIAGKC